MDNVQLLGGLATIAVIDLVLAGNNAVLIALATRNLSGATRLWAVACGILAAAAVRPVLAIAVVKVLEHPGFLALGGGLLAVVAYRLVVPGKGRRARTPDNFWSAMRTLLVADAAMGVDNVLAVAGASEGNLALAVAGVLASVPIVAWGAGFFLRAIERFPWLLTAGAAVIAWTAAGMIAADPLLAHGFDDWPFGRGLVYVATVCAVLGTAWGWKNVYARVRAAIAAG
ncbi:MAG: YjbE family putative metal transport protein [Clostridia bacterium]